MSESNLQVNEAIMAEKTAAEQDMQQQSPTDEEMMLDEELGDELIIEDFTIDGICGVY